MNKHSIDSNHLRKSNLDQDASRIKDYLKKVVVNASQVTTGVMQLQTMIGGITQTNHNHSVLNTVKDISINAQARLKLVNHQLTALKNYNSRIDVIMKKFKDKLIHPVEVTTNIEQLRSLIKQTGDQIRREQLHNQLALAKVNQIRWFMTISKHDLGCIKIFYVDSHNRVIKRQTELGQIGKSFSLITHLTLLPHRYHFVKVIFGQHLMVYRHDVQRAVVEIAKNPVTPQLKADQKPQVALDAQRSCQIRLIYLDPRGKVIQIHNLMGAKGASFKLHQAIQLPDGYDLVKIISGLNVKQYQQRTQLIEVKVKPRSSGSDHQINADQVRQAFLDYYNARIMDVLPHSSSPSARFGYHCARQYLRGISDAYHSIAPQKRAQLYRRGYQICHYLDTKQPIKAHSFSDVLLKIYNVVLHDVALLDHDLRRGGVDF